VDLSSEGFGFVLELCKYGGDILKELSLNGCKWITDDLFLTIINSCKSLEK